MKVKKLFKENLQPLPVVTDPRWEQWILPLLEYIEKPKPVKVLFAWARAGKVSGDVLRNLLAWANLNGRAGAFYYRNKKTGDRVMAWKKLEPKPIVIEEPIDTFAINYVECGCPVCGGALIRTEIAWECASCTRLIGSGTEIDLEKD